MLDLPCVRDPKDDDTARKMLRESFDSYVGSTEALKMAWGMRGVDPCTQRRVLISALINTTLATLLTHRHVHDQMMATRELARDIPNLRRIAEDFGHSIAMLMEQADPTSTYTMLFVRKDK